MAYSKSPQQSTYQTKQVSILKQQNQRNALPTKDEDYLNVYFDLIDNKGLKDNDFHIVKRPGTASYISSVPGPSIRGMHYNEDFRKLYYVADDTLYIWDVGSGSLSGSVPAIFISNTGDVGFTDYLYDTGSTVVILTDGTELFQINSSNVVTPCTDPDMPVHLPNPVFLDGYLFLIKADTSDIYNSDLNDPLSWTPGNFISAEIGPDLARKIAKLNNYLIVFGTTTIEYFWDAGNATGSPLQRNDTPVKFNGYLGGFAQYGNTCYFVGNDIQGQPSAYKLEDFKIEEISTPTIVRYLTSLVTTYSLKRASIICSDGHAFYLIDYGTLTYVYDITSKQWARWGYQALQGFGMDFAITVKDTNDTKALFCFNNSTQIYQMSPTFTSDSGVIYSASGVTDNQFFDTYNQKAMHRLVVQADRPTIAASLDVSWSDDDYQTFSTPRSIQLNQELPSMHRLGRFRRRAFKWTFTADSPFRLKGMEVDINLGQH